jgi:hypothetical protein
MSPVALVAFLVFLALISVAAGFYDLQTIWELVNK